jgi:CheY-like chemotaxis protein
VVSRPSVLVVDRSAETREVLRTALAGLGAQIWEATQAEAALELARKHRPDVIVLDLEIAQSASESVRAALGDPHSTVAPIVLLGTARRVKKDFPAGQFVAKPYDYAPLVRKIEGLLDEARRRSDRSA